MKKIILFILLIMGLYTKCLSQDQALFSIRIDSAKTILEENGNNNKKLVLNATITNLTTSTLKFKNPSQYRQYQIINGWNLLLNKNGSLCEWDINKSFITEYLREFKVKKDKKIQLIYSCSLEDLKSNENMSGLYSIQLELTNIETKKEKKQTIKSNIIQLEIE